MLSFQDLLRDQDVAEEKTFVCQTPYRSLETPHVCLDSDFEMPPTPFYFQPSTPFFGEDVYFVTKDEIEDTEIVKEPEEIKTDAVKKESGCKFSNKTLLNTKETMLSDAVKEPNKPKTEAIDTVQTSEETMLVELKELKSEPTDGFQKTWPTFKETDTLKVKELEMLKMDAEPEETIRHLLKKQLPTSEEMVKLLFSPDVFKKPMFVPKKSNGKPTVKMMKLLKERDSNQNKELNEKKKNQRGKSGEKESVAHCDIRFKTLLKRKKTIETDIKKILKFEKNNVTKLVKNKKKQLLKPVENKILKSYKIPKLLKPAEIEKSKQNSKLTEPVEKDLKFIEKDFKPIEKDLKPIEKDLKPIENKKNNKIPKLSKPMEIEKFKRKLYDEDELIVSSETILKYQDMLLRMHNYAKLEHKMEGCGKDEKDVLILHPSIQDYLFIYGNDYFENDRHIQ